MSSEQLEQLGERIAEQAAHFDAAMHRLLTDLREFDERGGWHVQGAASCAHWLAWRVGWDLVTARDRVRVARKLAGFAAIDDALRRGEISYSKVRAMLRVATPANEALLLDHARLMTASQLEELMRKYALVQRHGQDPHPLDDAQRRYVRRRDTEDGMVKIEAVLHPEEAELVWTMLDQAAARAARDPDSHADDASAESRDAMLANSTAGVAAGCADANPDDASAESRDVTLINGTAAATAGCTDASPHDASAESRDATLVNGTAAATEGCTDASTHDASAESRDATLVNITAGVVAGGADANPDDASAESRHVPVANGAAKVASCADAGPDDASAESRDVTLASRPLLDRLLDELDALRGARAAAVDVPDDDQPSPTERAPARPDVAPPRVDAAGRAFSRADALVSLAQRYLRGERPNRAPIEVVLTISADSLRGDAAADPLEVGDLGASCVSREAARRLSCDAGVVEVVEDEHGAPLSVGRKHRTIAGALKRALSKRDRGCTYPACTNRLFLEGHHIKHWADGGETSLSNAALLCSLHHRFVHEYGYTIELGSDQRPRFRDRSGRLVVEAPTRPTATATVGWQVICSNNEALAIDTKTCACEWDGQPVDYGTIVGHLLAADGLS